MLREKKGETQIQRHWSANFQCTRHLINWATLAKLKTIPEFDFYNRLLTGFPHLQSSLQNVARGFSKCKFHCFTYLLKLLNSSSFPQDKVQVSQPFFHDPNPCLSFPASPSALLPSTLLSKTHLSHATHLWLYLHCSMSAIASPSILPILYLTFSGHIHAFQGLVQMSPLCETLPDFFSDNLHFSLLS